MAQTLAYDFTRETLAMATEAGPTPVFSRASDATYFDSSGVMQTAASGAVRLAAHLYNGTAWINHGFYKEEASQNNFLQSEDLSTTTVATTTTLSTFATAAPDGDVDADDVLHTGESGSLIQSITVTNNTKVTISAHVRQGTTGAHDWVKMEWRDASDDDNGFEFWANVSDGTIGTAQASGTGSYTANSARIEDMGGWYRISASGQIVTGQTDGELVMTNVTADAVDTIEQTNSVAWWGIQQEEKAFRTSYIATTTIAKARVTDAMYLENSASELEVYGYTHDALGSLVITATAGDASLDPNNKVLMGSSGSLLMFIDANSANIKAFDGASVPLLAVTSNNTQFRLAMNWDGVNAIRSSLDGAAVTADSYDGDWGFATADQYIGSQAAGSKVANGFIKKINFYDTTILTDAELRAGRIISPGGAVVAMASRRQHMKF